MTDKEHTPFIHFEPLPHKVINTRVSFRVSFPDDQSVDDINNEELIIKVGYSKK